MPLTVMGRLTGRAGVLTRPTNVMNMEKECIRACMSGVNMYEWCLKPSVHEHVQNRDVGRIAYTALSRAFR